MQDDGIGEIPASEPPAPAYSTPAFEAFKALVGDPDGYRLDEAALAIALESGAEVNIPNWLCYLDVMAEELLPHVDPDDMERTVARLNEYLFVEKGFRGNCGQYYDERNSYLHEVLRRRLGIPITLSLLYMELGRRIGLPVQGVGLPGHFIVRIEHPEGPMFLDPFNGGVPLTETDCHKKVIEVCGREMALGAEHLQPMDPSRLLVRMLRNLKWIHLRRGRLDRALGSVERILLLEPGNLQEIRDRGVIYTGLECFRSARRDFRHYLDSAPQAEDAQLVRQQLQELDSHHRHQLH